MKNVIILYGGKSCEHDISVITACLARGYFANANLFGVYLDRNNAAFLVPNNFSPAMHLNAKLTQKVVFLTGEKSLAVLKHNRIVKRIAIDAVVNCCHGAHGEDGTAAALCGLLNVPLVGSALTPSAIAMDKILAKTVLSAKGFPTVAGFEANQDNVQSLCQKLPQGFEFPLIVKPNSLGSSIGVALCRNFGDLRNNLNSAFAYDGKVLCETALTDFCELNCAAMRTQNQIAVSRVDAPATLNDLLTFDDKYLGGGSASKASVEVPVEVYEQVQTLTKRIYEEFDFGGVIRVDYLYDKTDTKLYVNEINSIPGSLAYGLFDGVFGMTEYGDALLKQAQLDFGTASKLVASFPSSVLAQGRAKGSKSK